MNDLARLAALDLENAQSLCRLESIAREIRHWIFGLLFLVFVLGLMVRHQARPVIIECPHDDAPAVSKTLSVERVTSPRGLVR